MTKRIILLLFLALLISGCSQPGPIKLPESAYEKSELRETDYKSISEKINSGENFILYVYTNHCEACMSFKPVLEEFIEERGITIFAIEKAAIEKGSKLDKEVKLAPTVLIIGNKKQSRGSIRTGGKIKRTMKRAMASPPGSTNTSSMNAPNL